MPWIPSDVRHENVGSLTFPAKKGRVDAAYFSSIDVAAHCSERGYAVKLFCEDEASNVTCMPYLVALLKISLVAIVPMGMCVAEEPDAFHA